MPQPIRIYSYRSSSGRSLIEDWLSSLTPRARQDMRAKIRFLSDREKWGAAHIKPLKGDGKGLYEIILKSEKIQYRLLLCVGPRTASITLLLGATKSSSGGKTHWKPIDAIHTANARKIDVEGDRDRFSRDLEP